MKQTGGYLYLIVMYSVAGVFSVSTQKSVYEMAEDKVVAHQKNVRELVVQLLCNALEASNSAADGTQGMKRGDDLLLTSDDLQASLNGIRCQMRPQAAVYDDDDDDDDDSNAHLRRQVDPLHSCIEAKCSSLNSGSYLDCIYRQCISGFQLGVRSLFLAFKRNARISAPKADLSTTKIDGKEGHAKVGGRSLEEEDGQGRTADTTRSGSSSSSRGRAAGLRVMRRGFNDIADVCAQHHCGSLRPDSMNFFSCVESHCAFFR